MKRYLSLLSALLLTLFCTPTYAQNTPSNSEDFFLDRAYEVLREDGDEEQALDLVSRQLRESPDNVDALLLRTRLLRRRKDYREALQDINHALKVNNPKKTDCPNSTLYWWKGSIYEDMHDVDNATAAYKTAYEMAQKDDKENLQSISFDYAQMLYFKEDLDGADAVYRNMLSHNEADQAAMVGLSRNMLDRKQYREAVQILEKAQKFDADYSEVYHFKMKAYDKLGEATKAIDAALQWFDKDGDANLDAIVQVLKQRTAYADACIKSYIKNSEETFAWRAFQCLFYQGTHEYAQAVKAFDALESDFGRYYNINSYRSDCYSKLGLQGLAIADISRAMGDTGDWESYCYRADYYRLAGDLDSAIEDLSSAIEDCPDETFIYYRRGWCYEMKGDLKKALEDYNLGIELSDDYPYIYLMRGELLLQEGKLAEAEADFQKVLELDTIADDSSCRMYALHFLGRDKEAEEWMDQVIAYDPDDAGIHYDRSCLYARMGRPAEAIAALRTAFEKGYRQFSHLRLDDDMDPIRDLPEFKALVEEYEAKHTEYLKQFDFKLPDYRNNTLYL